MPRCSDLAIFVVTDRQTDRTDYFTPCACARGNDVPSVGMWKAIGHGLASSPAAHARNLILQAYICTKILFHSHKIRYTVLNAIRTIRYMHVHTPLDWGCGLRD
jgi:hypothetical protein